MNKFKRKIFLITCFALLFLFPFLGSIIKWNGFPPGYGLFPSQKASAIPGFSAAYFIPAIIFAAFIAAFIIFPKLFGFKDPIKSKNIKKKKTPFPVWFLPSLIVMFASWFLMWGRLKVVEPIDHYTFVPLWWAFILVLDSIVYKRNNGKSIISARPNTMIILAAVSCLSWFVFEYLNYFVVGNWYYPKNEIFTNFGNIFWFSLSYTTVLPAIFEWYTLLKTFKPMRERYTNGPKIKASKSFLIFALLLGFLLAFGMGRFPFILFWGLWAAPVPVLAPVLGLINYWTPFTPIKKGNWTALILIAVATLLNGFFWELWNFGSEWFHSSMPTNPNYWKYSVPYLDKFHIFSEMPLLGYWGYLFFGIVCWIIWLTAAYIFNFSPDIDPAEIKT